MAIPKDGIQIYNPRNDSYEVTAKIICVDNRPGAKETSFDLKINEAIQISTDGKKTWVEISQEQLVEMLPKGWHHTWTYESFDHALYWIVQGYKLAEARNPK